MEFYNVVYNTYHNGERFFKLVGTVLLEEVPQDKEIVFTWNNFHKLYERFGNEMPINVWNFRKGRMITFVGCKKHKKIVKEWKDELNLTLKITFVNISDCMSISDILNWYDSEKAIKYLKEKGLNITTNNN